MAPEAEVQGSSLSPVSPSSGRRVETPMRHRPQDAQIAGCPDQRASATSAALPASAVADALALSTKEAIRQTEDARRQIDFYRLAIRDAELAQREAEVAERAGELAAERKHLEEIAAGLELRVEKLKELAADCGLGLSAIKPS